MENHIDVIIPTYMNDNLTIRCLQSVIKYTKITYKIIWIDDGSSIESYNKVFEFLKNSQIEFQPHRFSENKGPATAINQGLKMAQSKYIALLNNDVVVTQGWLGKLIMALESSGTIGLVGTVADHTSSVCNYEKVLGPIKIEGKPEDYFNNHPFEIRIVGTNISYHCVAIKKEVIEKIGYLDDRFYAGGEDDDYNDRIRLARYHVAVCINCFVFHDHHATLNLIPNIQERRRQNVALLKRKRAERARQTKT